MAEYKLPGSYCKVACNEITNLVLNRLKYGDNINVRTEKDSSVVDFPYYFITIVAPGVEQDELIGDVTKLLFTEFGHLISRNKVFLDSHLDDFKKSVDYEQFKTYIINNQGLKAIKLVKDRTHCGLKEAHDFWKVQKEGYDKFGYFSS